MGSARGRTGGEPWREAGGSGGGRGGGGGGWGVRRSLGGGGRGGGGGGGRGRGGGGSGSKFPDTSAIIAVLADQLPGGMTAAQQQFAATRFVGTQKLTLALS